MTYKLFTAYCLLLTAYLFLSSCNNCQTCKVKDSVGNTFYFSDEQCTGIEKHKKDLKDDWACYNYTVRDSDGVVLLITPQVCGNVDSLNAITNVLYQTYIADSPNVVITPLETRVECADHGE